MFVESKRPQMSSFFFFFTKKVFSWSFLDRDLQCLLRQLSALCYSIVIFYNQQAGTLKD